MRMLGAGGMASVFLCEDERLGREVAVKRLHAHSPTQTAQRFAREAKVGASLNHPNLVSVYDTVTDDEAVLIVMELVRGESLADALRRRGPLETEEALSVVRDVASALDHAHSHGVVHRDIKPANVLLREDGMAKLVDLGIATAADQTRITQSGILLGTAAYMAPEQLDGGEAGPATDVYALSVVAFESLSGSRARSGRTPMEIAHQIATEGPPDLQEVWDEAPPEAAAVLCRGMARDPAERPASAGQLAEELEEAFEKDEPTVRTRKLGAAAPVPVESDGGGETAAPTTAPRRVEAAPARRTDERPERRRNAAVPITLAVVLLALAGIAAIAALSSGGDGEEQRSADSRQQDRQTPRERQREEPAAQQPQAEAPAAEQPAAPAPAPSSGSGSSASGSQLNDQGFALMQQGNYEDAVPVLRQAVASWPEDSRDITYAYALFNLGKSLNRSGSPDEAIPYLEKRLTWDDQRETVQAELDLARRNAG
ncbi:MAG TPA: serine/threonine-protein kinase [Thermoleophilaceae bacterium]|nr:serine/threonine-protein kinase [Thermoleophilaceae bacterium]